jgi:hypothetical protein
VTTRAASEVEPLDVLRQENEVLRSTIADARAAIDDLEDGLSAAGICWACRGASHDDGL